MAAYKRFAFDRDSGVGPGAAADAAALRGSTDYDSLRLWRAWRSVALDLEGGAKHAAVGGAEAASLLTERLQAWEAEAFTATSTPSGIGVVAPPATFGDAISRELQLLEAAVGAEGHPRK